MFRCPIIGPHEQPNPLVGKEVVLDAADRHVQLDRPQQNLDQVAGLAGIAAGKAVGVLHAEDAGRNPLGVFQGRGQPRSAVAAPHRSRPSSSVLTVHLPAFTLGQRAAVGPHWLGIEPCVSSVDLAA